MAFNRLMLTTVGKTLYAKAQQGKTLQFTRVGIGDGNIGGGSLVNRTALINQKLSLLIDAVQIVNENQSAIITTLKNDDLTEGFYFREIGIFAKDPDTQQEKLYLYDNAGADGEYIPDNQSGVMVNERLKFLLMLENVTSVSFVPSGNPIYLSMDDIDDTVHGESTLWSSGKTKAEIDTIASTMLTIAQEVDSHTLNTNNPHSTTKSHVGLGSVQNYSIASQAEAEAGTATNRYMTPQRTKQAMASVEASVSDLASQMSAKANQADLDTTNSTLAAMAKQLDNYSSYASGIDSNGIYTIVEYKRADTLLYMKSTLSNVDVNGNYQTDTWVFYGLDGITIINTILWEITYNSDGGIVSKVVAS